MTARQNVLLPMRLGQAGRRERRQRVSFLLDTLGITHCADRTGMRSRVELQEEPDHIGIWPDQAAGQEPE
jgi:ABC-type nitrate/sulfonate/bicarbonate transport system ATPase subunit